MDYIKIGDFLKELRIENKLTQKEVAELLIITPQTISKWELGQSLPSIDMLQALGRIYQVTLDEIINCKHNLNSKKSKIDSKFFLSLTIYFLLFLIGLSLFFVKYIYIDSRAIDLGPAQQPYEGYLKYVKVSVKLSQWLVLILTIFMPVLLATLQILDYRKKILITVTISWIISLTSLLVNFISDPNFKGAEIGLLLHIIYDLLLILVTIINLSYFNIDVYKLINKNKKTFIFAPLLVIVAIGLPHSYLEHQFYSFGYIQFILFFLMLATPCLLIYEIVNGSHFFIHLYYAFLGIILILNSLIDIFNSGLLTPSILQFIYLLFLVIPFYNGKLFNNNFKRLKLINFFIIVEFI